MSIQDNEFTDVMDEISVKNSLIRHLERENDELKERNDKLLDNCHRYSQERAEMEKQRDKYRTDNKWLANRNGEIIKREKRAIDDLKAEIEKSNTECWCGCNDDLKAEYMELKADNKRLNKVISLQNADIIQAERSN